MKGVEKMKPFVRKAPVMAGCIDRKFVSIEDFLACYPNTNKHFQKLLIDHFKGEYIIEKRDDSILYQMLNDICLKSVGDANVSPIVFRDGWVLWLRNEHERVISFFSGLFFSKEESWFDERDYRFLTKGLGWYISTTWSDVINCAENYSLLREDEGIFSKFTRYNVN